jgi:hypothetical protein
MSEIYEFDPVLMSNAENQFLLEHLSDAPVVARKVIPPGVNPKAVMPIIERVYELETLKAHDGDDWVGTDAMKARIKIWLSQNEKWKSDAKKSRRAPRWPSMFSFDGRGRAHLGGPSSDSGRVRSYFGPAGERLPFSLPLIPDNQIDWQAPTMAEPVGDNRLHVDELNHRIECRVKVGDGFCGHTETYKVASRSSHNAARARMSKHLRKATEERESHLEVYTNEFGGNDAG